MPLPEGFTLEKQSPVSLPEGFKLEAPTQGGLSLPAGFTLEKPEPTPESQSGFRQIADVPLQVTKGAVEGVRMLTDVLGADNPVSKGLRGVEDYVGDLLSAQSKKDAKEISRIMKDAEDKGVADQVVAGVKAFSVAPVDTLSRVFGNAMPAIAGGLASYLLRGGAAAATAIGAGTGAAMGTGSVKGSIYDAVKEVLSTNTKLPPDQIEKRAALAQSYNGDNLDQILMGTAIGGISAASGLESVVARQLAQKIAGRSTGNILQREAVEKATQEATKTAAKRGPYKQAAITGVTESGTEFGQEAQEQVAQNIAQQREGFNVPTFRGAVGAGTLGALSATGLGAYAGGREGAQARKQMELEGTPEGQQIKNLDTLLAQEEKQQRITELEQKPTRTKQEQIEVDALKQSLAAGPALTSQTQQDMTVPPAKDELTRLKAKVDEAKAKVDAAEQRFGEAPEFLVDDYEGWKAALESKLQALEPPAVRKERAAREKVQKETDAERAAIQAGNVDETQLEGPEPPDIFAPAPKQTAIVDPFEVDPFAEETAQETLKPRAQEVVEETPADQGAPIATEVLDEDAVMAKVTPITQDANVMSAAPEYQEEVIAPALNAIQTGNFQPVTLKNGTKVKLVVGNNPEDTEGRVTAFDENNNEIGHVMYTKAEDEEGNRFNPHTEVNEEYRRLGLATAMYDAAEQIGGALIPEVTQEGQIRSPEGQAFREARKQKAVPTAQKTDEEIIAEEDKRNADQDARKANAREIAKTNFETAIDQVDSPEFNGDLDAALDSYRQNTLDTLAEQGERDQYVSDAADREFDKLVKKHKELKAAADRFLNQKPIDFEALTTRLTEEGNPETTRTATEALAHGDDVYAVDVDDLFNITPDTVRSLQKLTTPKQVAEAVKEGNKILSLSTEAGDTSRANALHTEIRALTDKQQKLLTKAGKLPAVGTKKREQWDELNTQIEKKKKAWSALTRKTELPGALFADPQGKNKTGLHPDVIAAIENNDINGALRAMARNTSGFTRELALRLAELNLPTNIVFGRQRQLLRKEIDRQTAQQQVRLFSYIRQMYPDLYTKFFENFDREENLERVMNGLREFDKDKYNKAPIDNEFRSVLKVFGDTVPNMDAPGVFLPAFDVINLNPDPYFGTANRVVLHEIIHAATQYALHDTQGLTDRQLEAVAELHNLYKIAKERLPAGFYGLTNIYEFVAEVLTNKTFNDKLKTISYKGRKDSLLTRFVKAIAQLFGFDNLAGAAAVEINEILSPNRRQLPIPLGPMFSKKNNAGPISNPDEWRTAERDSKTIKQRISDLMGGHPTKADALKDLKDIIFDVAGNSARKVILPVLQLRQLKDMTRGTIPQLEASVGIVEQMTSYRGNKISGPVNGDVSKSPEGITKRWSKAQGENPAQSRLMGRLMLEVTMRGIEVDPKGDGYNATKVNKALSDAWNTLTPEFQEIYRDARDYYARSVQDMVQAMKDKTKGLPNDERAKLLKEIDNQFGPDKLVRPYFPLRRFGDYWFQVGEGDKKEFYMFESAAERRRALNERRRELQNGNQQQQELADTLYAGQGISTIYSHNANTSKVLGDINKMVDQLTTADPAQLKGEIKDSINQLVYLLLPQQSMRKMFINRRAVQGASADMLRVFAMTSVHSAYQQARFKFAEPFMNNITNADKYIDQLPVEQQIVYRDFVRELEARSQTVLGIEDKSAWAKMAGRITESTFFFMLTAPASAMLNIIGMQAITMPYIGGKYGYAETNKLMLKNLGRYIGTTAKRTIGPLKAGAFSSIEFPSITDSKDLDPIERRAAERFTQDGQWNISSTHDVFSMSEQPSAMYTGRTNTVKQALAAMFHQAERLNREVAMLTAFKLAYEKFKGSDKKDIRGVVARDQNGNPVKLTDDEAFEAAIADAGDIAGLTLGDYTRQMKGRIFTKPGVNVLLQFKQYAITTTYVVLRNLYLALGAPFSKGEIAQFRAELEKNNDLTTADIDKKIGEMEAQRKEMYKEGRRRLAGILGMAFLYGGVTAMPFFSMLGPLVRMFNDDDDDDEFLNWQNDFYNGMEDMLGGWASSMYLSMGGDPQKVADADAFGRAMASVVTRGAVSTATGTALADRVSTDLKNLWFRDGKFSPDMRESLKEEVIANLGPGIGLLFNWADGWKLFQEGQVGRAFETVAPAILSKPATAFRLGTVGATNKKGVVVGNMYPEEFSAWNLAMEALGFQTEKRAMAQKKAFQAVEYDQKVQARHDELMTRIYLDVKFGSDTLEGSLEEAAKFSAKYPGMAITAESVYNNVMLRATSDAEAEAIGARLNKKMLYKTLPMLGQ